MAKAFIESDFPIREVSAESAREKNIRHGHISTLHIWWARRPLASSRASIYAALTPTPENEEEREKKRQFIAELSKWENSLNEEIIGKARSEILHAFNGQSPKVLYCFAGGGAIKYNAVDLIFVHNHPSGSSEPSQSDKEITKDLIEASNTMQIKVLDHIIIGDNRYFSFADEGLIEEYNMNLLNINKVKGG